MAQLVYGVMKKMSASHKSGIGGVVTVGPISKTANSAKEIKQLAYEKFSYICRPFRKKFDKIQKVELVYPDGALVDNLPDGSQLFTLKGYTDFVDPMKRYDRLRLYLCDASELSLCLREYLMAPKTH
jgi:hypothetical protein